MALRNDNLSRWSERGLRCSVGDNVVDDGKIEVSTFGLMHDDRHVFAADRLAWSLCRKFLRQFDRSPNAFTLGRGDKSLRPRLHQIRAHLAGELRLLQQHAAGKNKFDGRVAFTRLFAQLIPSVARLSAAASTISLATLSPFAPTSKP